jgi:DNA-binding PadR family transcriptional regulator
VGVEIENYLPITETTFFILLSLSVQPMHGYAIMKEVRTLSQERIQLSTGTLYGALKRLLDQGWIERVNDDSPQPDQRERKYYSLTGQGRRTLEAEINRFGTLATLARQYTAGEQL